MALLGIRLGWDPRARLERIAVRAATPEPDLDPVAPVSPMFAQVAFQSCHELRPHAFGNSGHLPSSGRGIVNSSRPNPSVSESTPGPSPGARPVAGDSAGTGRSARGATRLTCVAPWGPPAGGFGLAVSISAVTLFMGFCVLYQLVVAAILLGRRPWGPVRAFVGWLLVLNSGVAVGFVLLSAGANPSWAGRWIAIFDDPTGALVVLLAIALLRRQELDQQTWPRSLRMATLVVAFLSVLDAATRLADRAPSAETRLIGVVIPVTVGYGLVLWAMVRRFTQAVKPEQAQALGLLAIGFGMRAVEFAWVYGVVPWKTQLSALSSGSPIAALESVTYLPLLVGVVGSLAYLGRRAWTSSTAARAWMPHVMVALLGGLLVGLAYAGQPLAADSPWYAVSVITLVLVRPAFSGLALEWSRTVRWTGIVGIGYGAFLGWKLLISALTDRPFLQLALSDALALGLAVAGLPFLVIALHRRGPRPVEPAVHRRVEPEVTHAHRLAQFLLSAHGTAQAPRGVTQREIHEGVGIASNNVAGEVRRMERLLAHVCRTPGVPLVDVNAVGVRGRKYYRLTPEGMRAAQRLLSDVPSPDSFRPPETPSR